MKHEIKHCDICEKHLSQRWIVRKIARKRGRRKRSNIAPRWYPRGIHICKTCRELPNIAKFLNNTKKKYDKNEKQTHELWEQRRGLDEDFIEMIQAFRNDRKDD